MSEWIEWNGGECPVGPECRVDIKQRDYVMDKPSKRAGDWAWDQVGTCTDIVAYRVINPEFDLKTAINEEVEFDWALHKWVEKGKATKSPSKKNSKYDKEIKGVTVDVYDVLKAFDVRCPALQHLIKKALQCGNRGHKTASEDYEDIIASAIRAKELNDDN